MNSDAHIKIEFSKSTDVEREVQDDLQNLINKYAEKNLPVEEVVHAYTRHCVDLVFLMNHSPENALDILGAHISSAYLNIDTQVH